MKNRRAITIQLRLLMVHLPKHIRRENMGVVGEGGVFGSIMK